MKAAIQTLASLPVRGRRIAVLGDMRELGGASAGCHREIGRLLAEEFEPDLLICVGSESRAVASEAIRLGMPSDRVEQFPDAASAATIATHFVAGDLVLLKGSRAVGLEAVARAILASRPTPLAAAS